MKTRSKKGNSIRLVEALIYRGKGKRSKQLLADANRADKNAMARKKAQRKHLIAITQ